LQDNSKSFGWIVMRFSG